MVSLSLVKVLFIAFIISNKALKNTLWESQREATKDVTLQPKGRNADNSRNRAN